MARQNITHILHDQRHILIPTDNGRNYTCNGCNLRGTGARYRCHSCDFDLHFLCAESPPQFFLSGHLMTLFLRPERSHDGTSLRRCDGCTQMVEGMFYHLEAYNYDLHPVCLIRQLQPQVAPNAAIRAPAGHHNGGGRLNGLLRLLDIGLDVLSILALFGGGFDISSLLDAFNV
ncbi:protein VACUOLELESS GAMETOPHYTES-like [Typha angustifolia]|uniref:protein VACUOLELESS GAMETOPHYTES-like n=1 Tax=Typha angustifolia TaxID=59011 RepID=UPI003C2FB77D